MQPADDSIFDQPTPPREGGPALPRFYRGRPWLTAFAALLTELVVVAAVDNQGVSGRLRHPLQDQSRILADYTRGAIDAATTFWWRFAPAGGQPTHVWAAQWAAIGTLFVLTLFGTAAISRGSVTFGRVWIGTWAVVAAVTPVAVMVRNAVVTPTAPGPAQSRVGQAIYGFGAFGPVLVCGFVLGLVVGLIAAVVAVGGRRQIGAAPLAAGTGERDEYFDDRFAPQYPAPAPYEPRPWGESQWQSAATTQLPAMPTEPAMPAMPTVPPAPPETQAPYWPPAPPPPVATGWPPGPDEYDDEQAGDDQADQLTEAIPVVPPANAVEQPPAEVPAAPPAEEQPPAEQHSQEQPTSRPAPVDEEALADELAVEEHTTELPRVEPAETGEMADGADSARDEPARPSGDR